MAESIIVVNFNVESEAYQAFADLKQNAVNDSFIVSQAGVIAKAGGVLSLKDGFDTGVETTDDTAIGGLVGAMLGIVGGPLGVLLCGSYGALVGNTLDAADSLDNISLVEKVCEVLTDDCTCLVALVSEENEGAFDAAFENYETEITRFDAAEVAVEIEEAAELQRQMEKEARKQLRAEKKANRKQKLEEKRTEIKAKFKKA